MKETSKRFVFSYDSKTFLRDGKPHRILSGALHYFRVVPEYWEDRLLKMRACGLNTVETYVCWNMHEPVKGKFCFDGLLDIRLFLQTVQKVGMDVILRPGPYICAEWSLGGLPSWLLAEKDIRLRCMNEVYLKHVADFFKRFLSEITSFQCTEGGPVIAVQVENEYGSYGNDYRYLEWTEQQLKDNGVEVMLFTSDGPEDDMLQGGGIEGILKTANFGSGAKEAFKKLREYQPTGPLMCMEFWNGWFDHWGEKHHVRDPEDAAVALDEILSEGASVNIYMMHGGTNWGLLNGANHDESYHSTVTSYDYDAPINEQGNITRKYELFREILEKHGAQVEPLPESKKASSYGRVAITEWASVMGTKSSFLAECIKSTVPLSMEEVGAGVEYVIYQTKVTGPRVGASLFIQEVRDVARVFLNKSYIGSIHRNEGLKPLPIEIPPEGATLEILVENQGYINYGPMLNDRKGITEGVRINRQFLYNWNIYPFALADLSALTWETSSKSRLDGLPTFYRASLVVDVLNDTFLRVCGGHGVVWINGFCLGRYFKSGPQSTLFLPAPLLSEGQNEIIILELENNEALFLESLNEPALMSSSTN